MKTFGDRLKYARVIQSEYTQESLGKKAKITAAHISHFESNRRLPNIHNLIKLAKALNVTTDFLLGLTS